MYLNFNKIYFIESLNLKLDETTALYLYNSLPYSNIVYVDPDTPKELFRELSKIEKDCIKKGIKPIIDISMHGIQDNGGLNSGMGQSIIKNYLRVLLG